MIQPTPRVNRTLKGRIKFPWLDMKSPQKAFQD